MTKDSDQTVHREKRKLKMAQMKGCSTSLIRNVKNESYTEVSFSPIIPDKNQKTGLRAVMTRLWKTKWSHIHYCFNPYEGATISIKIVSHLFFNPAIPPPRNLIYR